MSESDLSNLTREQLYEKAIEAIDRFNEKINSIRKSIEAKKQKDQPSESLLQYDHYFCLNCKLIQSYVETDGICHKCNVQMIIQPGTKRFGWQQS